MKPVVDKDKCIGCGVCIALCPTSFKWDESGVKAESVNASGDTEEMIKGATEACPVQAISLGE
ncbi:MAG: 4Fe-4S ferredoxin iron-sulfur binding domain protein [Candidatus Magasanikbacteria bacterium GW2011_GWC2_40_17]|uniref:Ferredoxin n=2 Tax=Candidatus Magasanikiibacteriota TaxID=1752731 RepID=A0A0G1CG10_9BACT|nr:MAG: 4Fe-4S ferredoxin iron-sulfur binding domain protein [Candidatus Magasanikbacteria bacterium GW2011_GWC2_40_17]KKS57501.1 MAG: 4Fe-4S ferredoxin iron-sulfur binding domain protein [Candidatus Magasanikbacteria bacterium GW2011_GWA2_42_32]OGH84387.1 MAG: hypothetical protein A2261_00090 [Candidatus Magasanikbacteria bacterium RIFOXYA2_FULL_44_8]OGH85217.1 MAG: hypothetical protein A2294_00530 [Candidatus Magasanikbacteria bacterium RIFOXYB2_FULL_38_10]